MTAHAESPPPVSDVVRFRLCSAGGTFQGLHLGHRRYLQLGLAMSVKLHVFVATDSYVRQLKTYDPQPYGEREEAVRGFLDSVAAVSRYVIEPLKSDSQLEEWVMETGELDCAVVETAYVNAFLRLNERRRAEQLDELYLMVKPRTRLGGEDLSATDRHLT
jgi:cytidyltransferase-like protein